MKLAMRDWTLNKLVATILSIGLLGGRLLSQQTKAKPPDPAIEAANYLAEADKDLTCTPDESRNWSKKALATVSSVRERDPATRDMLGDLKAQSNLKLDKATKRLEALEQASQLAKKQAKKAQVETASRTLSAQDPDRCWAGQQSLRGKLNAQRNRAAEFTSRADQLVSTKPRKARKLYKEAAKYDWELDGLQAKRDRAAGTRAPKHRRTRRVRDPNTALLFLGTPCRSPALVSS